MLEVFLLGGLRLERDGVPVTPPPSARSRELLVWLALHPGHHPRGVAACALRPEASEDAARQTLRQALLGLRGVLDAAELDAGRDTVALTSAVTTDLARLRRAADAGDRDAVLALTRPVAPAVSAAWLDDVRRDLAAEVPARAARLAAAAEEAGDLPGALLWAALRAAHDPLSETAQREHIRLLALTGDRAAALAAAEALRRRLADELGVPPSPETRRLITAVLTEDAPTGPPVPDAPIGGAGRQSTAARSMPQEGFAPFGGAGRQSTTAGSGPLEGSAPRGGAGRQSTATGSAPPEGSAPIDGARRRSAETPPLPGPLVERSAGPLVGRDAELEVLTGEPGWVLLAGEPGIGKTRLASAAARARHAEGWTVLFGRCDRDALSPHQPLAEALDRAVADGTLSANRIPGHHRGPLARMLPALAAQATDGTGGAPDAGDGARLHLFEAVRAALEAVAVTAPVLLVVDDLHWATAETLALAGHLRRTLDPERVAVVATFRDTSLGGPGHPLAEALADWRRDGVTVVEVPPLGADAVAAFVAWCRDAPDDGLAEVLHRRTGGNPLFLVESLRDISERGGDAPAGEVPLAVRDVIEQRIARLGPEAAPVLRAAAIAAPEFTLRDVEAVTGDASDTPLEVLEAATRARLVRELPGSGRMTFTHALVAETILSGMSAARRGRLHLRLGAHLAATGGAPAEVARHLLAAAPEGDPAERALWARRAADLAVGVAAYDRAADLLRRALGPDLPPAAASAVHEGLGVALDRLGRRDEARAAFLAAADHARTAGDTDLLARAALGHAGYAVAIGAPDPVTVALLEEVRAASPPPAPALHARVCAALATERYYPDRDEADRLSREALDRAPDDATRAHVLSARHVVLWRADGAHERLAVADRMRDLALASGDPLAELQARNWRVIDLMELTRIGEAEEEIAAYAALAGRLRLPRHGWYVPLWRAAIAIVRGDLDAADALNREAAEAGAGSGDPNAEGHVWIQRHLILMEGDRVAEIDLDAIMHRARRSPTGMGAWLGWLGMMYARAGDMDTAGALLDELARDGFAQLPDDANWHAACEAADVCARVGAAGHARTLVPRLAPYAGLTPVVARGVGVYPPVALHLGRLHRLLGETAASEAALDRAEAIAVRLGATPWLRAVAEVRAAVP